jgi:hypothetical protein
MGARAARPTIALAALALAVAACGSSHATPKGPPAARVCDAARRAAAQTVGKPVTLRITDHDPAYIQCTVQGGGTKFSILAEADAQAYTAYDTTTAHLAQANGAAGKPQNPLSVPGVGAVASWYAGERELVATSATLYRGGCFVTVSVMGWSSKSVSPLAASRLLARRIFTVAPRGPDPAPPPQ